MQVVRAMFKGAAIKAIISAAVLGITSASAYAEANNLTLSISPYSEDSFSDLIKQAELAAQHTIIQKFNQDPTLIELNITVLSEYNGQVVPLITSTVSRSDWQASPNITRWTKYLSISYALLVFGNTEGSDAVIRSEPIPIASRPVDPILEIIRSAEQAVDEGRMSEEELNELIDELD